MTIFIYELVHYYAAELVRAGAEVYSLGEKTADIEIEVSKVEVFPSGVIITKGDFNLLIPRKEYTDFCFTFS